MAETTHGTFLQRGVPFFYRAFSYRRYVAPALHTGGKKFELVGRALKSLLLNQRVLSEVDCAKDPTYYQADCQPHTLRMDQTLIS